MWFPSLGARYPDKECGNAGSVLQASGEKRHMQSGGCIRTLTTGMHEMHLVCFNHIRIGKLATAMCEVNR
jgi:hypothetical protein